MKLIIEDYKASLILGVYDYEKKSKCNILISLTIDYNPVEASKNDDVSYTIDYDQISERIDSFLNAKNYNLIEKLICDLGEDLLKYFSLINSIEISIEKLGIMEKASKVIIKECFSRV